MSRGILLYRRRWRQKGLKISITTNVLQVDTSDCQAVRVRKEKESLDFVPVPYSFTKYPSRHNEHLFTWVSLKSFTPTQYTVAPSSLDRLAWNKEKRNDVNTNDYFYLQTIFLTGRCLKQLVFYEHMNWLRFNESEILLLLMFISKIHVWRTQRLAMLPIAGRLEVDDLWGS